MGFLNLYSQELEYNKLYNLKELNHDMIHRFSMSLEDTLDFRFRMFSIGSRMINEHKLHIISLFPLEKFKSDSFVYVDKFHKNETTPVVCSIKEIQYYKTNFIFKENGFTRNCDYFLSSQLYSCIVDFYQIKTFIKYKYYHNLYLRNQISDDIITEFVKLRANKIGRKIRKIEEVPSPTNFAYSLFTHDTGFSLEKPDPLISEKSIILP
tara:strand:- start:608 stop:1234 length:627 start_codon:yes stop_codon:yes gene_type:complete